VRFRHELPKGDIPKYRGAAWVEADDRGDRFAFIVTTWRGGSRFFDISGKVVASRIMVYSDTGQELASVAVPVGAAFHHDFDFSLSPDGLRLAILDTGIVTVLDLNAGVR
jgi:hypothetical protein